MPATTNPVKEHTMPDGSVVYFNKEKHVYKLINEKTGKPTVRIPGVSTVASAFPDRPDGLMYWTESQTIEGILTLLEEEERQYIPISVDGLRKLLDDRGLRYCNERDRAASRGTAIHEQILEALATGEDIPDLECLEEDERGYGQAVMKFWIDHNPQVLQAEQITFYKDWEVAGKFDLRAKINDEIWLIDAKTSNKVRAREHVQIEGYELLNRYCRIGSSDRRILLHLSSDGTYELIESEATGEDFQVALSAHFRKKGLDRALYAAEKQRSKNAKAA